jgi:hypothetical protein
MNKTQPSLTAMLGEVLPLICTIAVAGPPVIFLALPWLVLGLMLSGWFALLLTFAALFVALVLVVAALVALFTLPVVWLRGRRVPSPSFAPPAQVRVAS